MKRATDNKAYLIECPVCEGKVSSKAVFCPHCGHPFEEIETNVELFAFFDSDEFVCLASMDDDNGGLCFCYPECFGMVSDGEVTLALWAWCCIHNFDVFFEIDDDRGTDRIWHLDIAEEPIRIEETFELFNNPYEYTEPSLDYRIGYINEDGKKVVLIKGSILFDTSSFPWVAVQSEYMESVLEVLDEDDFDESWGLIWPSEEDEGDSIGDTERQSYEDGILDPSEWDEESYLRGQGYTVSQTEGLTDAQRQVILANVLDSKMMTKNQIIDHLEKMINLRKTRPQYFLAISKWEKDIAFVKGY